MELSKTIVACLALSSFSVASSVTDANAQCQNRQPVLEQIVTPCSTPEFIPPRTNCKGDADFAGHGPKVVVTARLLQPNPYQIYAEVTMSAIENGGDGTAAAGRATYLVYSSSRPIVYVEGLGACSSGSYVDKNHKTDTICAAHGPAARFDVVGDTKGPEAGTRTSVRVHFRQLRIQVAN